MQTKWQNLSLSEAGVTLLDCVHDTPKDQGEGFPYIAIPQMKDGYLTLEGSRKISEVDFTAWTKKANPEVNDVVLSRRCNPGVTAHVPALFQFALGQNLVLLRSNGEIIYRPYLRWMCRGTEWWGQVNKYINAGAVFDSLRCKEIPSFELPIPPLNEQKAIAHILGTLDEKIELNRQCNKTLESIAQAIFKSWFVDFDPVHYKMNGSASGSSQATDKTAPYSLSPEILKLFPDSFEESKLGEIPTGWQVKSIDETTSEIIDHRGKTPTKLGGSWAEAGYSAISAKNIKNGRLVNHQAIKFVNEDLYNRWMKVPLEVGDTILTSEAPLGELLYLATKKQYCLSQRLYAIRADLETLSASYLYHWLASPQCRFEMASRATGTTVVGIKQSELRKVSVLLPNREVQENFDLIVNPMLVSIEQNSSEIITLAKLRDSLLPKLISGTLRIKDAEKFLKDAPL